MSNTVHVVCGGNEMGDEDRSESTVVCATEEVANSVAKEMEDSGLYDWADIFEMDVVS